MWLVVNVEREEFQCDLIWTHIILYCICMLVRGKQMDMGASHCVTGLFDVCMKKSGAWFIFCDNVMNNAIFLSFILNVSVSLSSSMSYQFWIFLVRYRDVFLILCLRKAGIFFLSKPITEHLYYTNQHPFLIRKEIYKNGRVFVK